MTRFAKSSIRASIFVLFVSSWFSSLHLCENLIRDCLHGLLRFGIQTSLCLLTCWHCASDARSPIAVVTKFCFFQTMARIGNAEALLDLQQILELWWRHRLGRHAELRADENCAAVSFENLHFEVGVLDVVMA